MALFPIYKEAVSFDMAFDPDEEVRFVAGFRLTPRGVSATFEGTVSHYVQGLAVDPAGAVLVRVEESMPDDAAWVAGMPVDRLTGQILCTYEPAVVYSNGLPFAASGLLCALAPPDNLIGEDESNLLGEDGAVLYSEV